jgi:hypothetical protein
MKRQFWKGLVLVPAITGLLCISTFAQKPKGAAAAAPKPIIFAVLGDGSSLEPIATVSAGKLFAPVNGSDDQKKIVAFDKAYYKAGTSYRLIFGGANAGTVKVKSYDPNAECSRNMAEATTTSTTAKLKGLVMGLATNVAGKTAATSFRRKPTAAEKTEIDALARAEFQKQKLTPKELHYQNLTAVDVDKDGTAEFVGSYWVEIDKMTRGLLFFIAQKGAKGGYTLAFKEYRNVDQANVMSGDIKSVDEGVYHELLLDVLDYNGDGTAEIFTYTQSFEGSGFNVYRRNQGKWIKGYDFANYHCGY